MTRDLSSIHDENKKLLLPLRTALRSCDAGQVRAALFEIFSPEARIQLGHPFGELVGPEELWQRVYQPLMAAMPDMERRDFIVMAGPRWGEGNTGNWVGLGGNFVGHLSSKWLGIPASDKPVFMRYHEYLRFENGKVVELQGLWDIPQLMLQIGVWPMMPQAGFDWMCPGPADGQGVINTAHDPATSSAAVQLVWDMLHDLKQGTASTPERGLGGFWHQHALWYGPTGLGSARGHDAIANNIFRQFREGLSDNIRHLENGVFFGDGNLVAFTGWPSGTACHSGEGFLGLTPTGKQVKRASLDFWHIENGLIRECWVMVDMLDIYRQLGIDVFARMQALIDENKAA